MVLQVKWIWVKGSKGECGYAVMCVSGKAEIDFFLTCHCEERCDVAMDDRWATALGSLAPLLQVSS